MISTDIVQVEKLMSGESGHGFLIRMELILIPTGLLQNKDYAKNIKESTYVSDTKTFQIINDDTILNLGFIFLKIINK